MGEVNRFLIILVTGLNSHGIKPLQFSRINSHPWKYHRPQLKSSLKDIHFERVDDVIMQSGHH